MKLTIKNGRVWLDAREVEQWAEIHILNLGAGPMSVTIRETNRTSVSMTMEELAATGNTVGSICSAGVMDARLLEVKADHGAHGLLNGNCAGEITTTGKFSVNALNG